MAKASITVKPSIFRDKVREKPWDGDAVGKTSGLKLTHFVSELLVANRKAHLTDEQLMAAMKAEFPKRSDEGGKGGRTIQKIASYRSYFNQGLHGHNPDKQFGHSVSYTADGAERVRGEGVAKAGKAKAAGKGKGKGKAAAKPVAKAASKGKAAAA